MRSHNSAAGGAIRIVEVEETASTNQLALRLAADGERGPLWVTARRQTAGRGRSGRPWVSLPGNLHATLLLTPECPVAVAAELALVAGVAAVDAVGRVAGRPLDGLRVKWPNDILVAGAKLGGVLIESSRVRGGSALAVAVGIGLDLVAAPDDPQRRITHLAAHSVAVDSKSMLAQLSGAMAFWLGRWDSGRGFPDIRSAWIERAGPVGERVAVNTGRGPVEGRYLGLDLDGALLVADEAGGRQRFTFGDVTLIGESGT